MTRTASNAFRAWLRLVAGALLLLPLASCFPEFAHPLPPPSELKADRQVVGTWIKVQRSGVKSLLHVFPRSNGWIDLVWINGIDDKGATDGITVHILEGYSAYVNQQKFLCFRFRKKDGQEQEEYANLHWLIANYETPDDGTLILNAFSQEKVKELIRKGKLKGEVLNVGGDDHRVIVTSSSDELIETISQEGVGAFLQENKSHTIIFSRSRIMEAH